MWLAVVIGTALAWAGVVALIVSWSAMAARGDQDDRVREL